MDVYDDMIKVSIIVPVYNSEKYIKQCIESLKEQTCHNFELIIINDGSTDKSFEIIDSLIKDVDNFHLYNQSNKGVSSARNFGISKAKGEYISFIDSDDYINNDFVEVLISKLKNNSWDFVISGLSYIYEHKVSESIHLDDKEWIPKRAHEWVSLFKTELLTSPVAKLYKKEIIIKNNIYFDPKLSFAEDRDFNITFLTHTNKILVCKYIGYNYNKDVVNSLSKKTHLNKLKNDYKYWNKLYLHITKINQGHYNDSYLANLLYHFTIDNYIELFKNNSIKDAYRIIQESRNYYNKEYIKNNFRFINAPKWQKRIYRLNHYLLLLSIFIIARTSQINERKNYLY